MMSGVSRGYEVDLLSLEGLQVDPSPGPRDPQGPA